MCQCQRSNSSSGRGLTSPRSTRRTISTIRSCVGAGQPASLAFCTMKPFSSPISVRAALLDVLRHRGALEVAARLRTRPLHHVRLDRGERGRIALRGGEQLRRLEAGDALELIAERLPDPDRLAGEADHHAADHRHGASRSLPLMPVAALTPLRMPLTHSFDQRSPHRLVVDGGAVDRREHVAQLLRRAAVTRPCASPT